MARAIADGAPIAALVTVAAWFHDLAAIGLLRWRGGHCGPDGPRQNRSGEVPANGRGGSGRGLRSERPSSAAMFFPLEYYALSEHGAVRASPNKLAVMSWTDWFTYDGLVSAPSVTVPTLMVHSDEAVFPDNARRFYAALAGPRTSSGRRARKPTSTTRTRTSPRRWMPRRHTSLVSSPSIVRNDG